MSLNRSNENKIFSKRSFINPRMSDENWAEKSYPMTLNDRNFSTKIQIIVKMQVVSLEIILMQTHSYMKLLYDFRAKFLSKIQIYHRKVKKNTSSAYGFELTASFFVFAFGAILAAVTAPIGWNASFIGIAAKFRIWADSQVNWRGWLVN